MSPSNEAPKPLQSYEDITHAFAFATCHAEDQEVAGGIMKALAKNYKLMYYMAHLDVNPRSTAKEVMVTSFASVVLAFLSPSYMTSLEGLQELMQSQLGKSEPLPLVPVIVEPIVYMNDEAYETFLQQLPTEPLTLEKEEASGLRDLLEQMYQRLQRDSNYAFFSQETMMDWDKFMKEPDLPITPSLCYKICKEIINSLHCNFIFQPHYTEETLPYLYRDLGTRLRNSTGGTTNPFLDATVISAKEEKYYFNQYRAQGVKLEDYHALKPEECVIQGGTLVALNCSHKKVKLSFSVKEIGRYACEYNGTLEEILLPHGIQSIGKGAFQNCTQLRRVYLPKDMEEVGESAFEECNNLEEVNLPEGMEKIEQKAFFNCTNLKSIFMPDSLKEIGSFAFTHCVCLEALHLPASLKKVGEYAFDTCASLSSVLWTQGLEELEEGAFSYSALTQIHLPEGPTALGEKAFEGCYQLESVTLPASLTQVPSRAFAHCVNLATVTVPASLSVAEDAFEGCARLSSDVRGGT